MQVLRKAGGYAVEENEYSRTWRQVLLVVVRDVAYWVHTANYHIIPFVETAQPSEDYTCSSVV